MSVPVLQKIKQWTDQIPTWKKPIPHNLHRTDSTQSIHLVFYWLTKIIWPLRGSLTKRHSNVPCHIWEDLFSHYIGSITKLIQKTDKQALPTLSKFLLTVMSIKRG
jgi:hypothetical protein